MQPESFSSQEPQPPVVEAAAEVKRPRKPIGKIVLLILLILIVGGLGYWNTMLDANLKAANLSLAASQSRYDALTTRNTKLTSDLGQANSELTQVKTDLEAANAALKTTKQDLSKVNGQVSSFDSRKDKARPYVLILESVFMPDNEFKWMLISFEVTLIKDKELSRLFDAYIDQPNQKTYEAWIGYIISKLDEILQG